MEGEVYIELKYCERCGGLWFREHGSGQVYCERCLPLLDQLPSPTTRCAPQPPEDRGGVLEKVIEFEIHDIDATAWLVPGGEA